jgi:hypothetical protein
VHLFPVLPARDAFHKRRIRLCAQIEALIAHFARESPGYCDDLLLVDSTPVECARSRETAKRGGHSSLDDALANAADYGYCASHSRLFWGFRLHALFAPDSTPRALALTSPKIDEKLVCVQMLTRCERQPGRRLGSSGRRGVAMASGSTRCPAGPGGPKRSSDKLTGAFRSDEISALVPM